MKNVHEIARSVWCDKEFTGDQTIKKHQKITSNLVDLMWMVVVAF